MKAAFLAEKTRAILLSKSQEVCVHKPVLERLIDATGCGAGGEELMKAIENFPVSHVAQNEKGTLALTQSLIEVVETLKGNMRLNFIGGKKSGLHRSEEIGNGSLASGAGERMNFGEVFFGSESKAQIADGEVPVFWRKIVEDETDSRPEAIDEREGERS